MTDLGFIAATGGEVLCFLLGVGFVVYVVGASLFDNSKPAQGRSSYSPPQAPPSLPPVIVPDFTVRGQLKSIGEGGEKIDCIEVMVRGRVPVSYPQDLGVLVTLEDVTDGKPSPVFCPVGSLSDPLTHHFRHYRSLGRINPGVYLSDWCPIGVVPLVFAVTPHSGARRLRIRCRCIPATFEKLPLTDERVNYGVVCEAQTFYAASFPTTGYLELADKRREGMVATVELALACACADGTVDQRELRVVHRWMTACLTERNEDPAAELAKLKAGLNDAMKTGVRGGADIGAITSRIRKLSLPAVSQAALSLCVEVIAADGELHPEELKSVRSIASGLGLDYDQLQSLLDKQFVKSAVSSAQENLEAIVGIDPSWDKERIRKHLANQFMKWNSRAPSAKTVEDQGRIRMMLDAIAKLKKKYS